MIRRPKKKELTGKATKSSGKSASAISKTPFAAGSRASGSAESPAGLNGRWTVRVIVTALIIALFSVASGFWLLCTFSEGIDFLPAHQGAEWIVYPQPPETASHPVVPIAAVFRDAFTLKTPPAKAVLIVRAFKNATIAVNGQTVRDLQGADKNWKSPSTASVSGLLRAGTNNITVCVTNNTGPPALWLRLQTDQVSLGTDASWQASLAGAPWRNVRRATQPPVIPAWSLIYGSGAPGFFETSMAGDIALLCGVSGSGLGRQPMAAPTAGNSNRLRLNEAGLVCFCCRGCRARRASRQ